MASNYLFSLQPTFTQGLVLGQLSVLVLLALILKYFFLDSTQRPFDTFSYHPRLDVTVHSTIPEAHSEHHNHDQDPTEWLNVLVLQIVDVYRSKLRDDLSGLEGDEVARIRVENYANKMRPLGFLDPIRIHSIDLGTSAPRILKAHVKKQDSLMDISSDTIYKDTLSISLTTAYLFNYPMTSFARLPVSLTISLSQFRSTINIVPPAPNTTSPAVTFSVAPDFILDINTTSLMGSRAKLANVPKLHELIQHQVRRILAARGTWRIVLPGLSAPCETKDRVKTEKNEEQSLL